MKLSGIEMSYTWPAAGIHETVRYWNVLYHNAWADKRYCHSIYPPYTLAQPFIFPYTLGCMIARTTNALAVANWPPTVWETLPDWIMVQVSCTMGFYTWNCQVLKCHIHDLHETVRYWNVVYMTCSRYGWELSDIFQHVPSKLATWHWLYSWHFMVLYGEIPIISMMLLYWQKFLVAMTT